MSAVLLASSGAGVGILIIVYIAVIVFEIAALWQVVREGAVGPAGPRIIPFYNYYIDAQDRGPTGMVADPLLHPDREHHRLDHRGHRLGEVVRQEQRLRRRA